MRDPVAGETAAMTRNVLVYCAARRVGAVVVPDDPQAGVAALNAAREAAGRSFPAGFFRFPLYCLPPGYGIMSL